MEVEATNQLRFQWQPNRIARPAIERVADEYRLSLDVIRIPMLLQVNPHE